MTTALSYRPSTSGTTGSANGIVNRQASLSSFPSTRTPSTKSTHNGIHMAHGARFPRKGSNNSSKTPSTPTSARNTPQQNGTPRRVRKLRSQYPADSTERHVEYILVASFDVDRGSIMKHQYPGAISGDENMLAELMLPDQAHARKEDWTVFFLHKDTTEEDDDDAAEGHETEKSSQSTVEANDAAQGTDGASVVESTPEQEDVEGGEGPPLIYVLNLVNTKYDASAKRYVRADRCPPALADLMRNKRSDCKSNGNMYSTFVSPYL